MLTSNGSRSCTARHQWLPLPADSSRGPDGWVDGTLYTTEVKVLLKVHLLCSSQLLIRFQSIGQFWSLYRRTHKQAAERRRPRPTSGGDWISQGKKSNINHQCPEHRNPVADRTAKACDTDAHAILENGVAQKMPKSKLATR
jgi:hypothetical protein